jgi:hypothetical protein
MPTRREYIRKAIISFLAIPVVGLALYPFIKPEQRRGTYTVLGIIFGSALLVVVGMLVVKAQRDRASRDAAPRPPRSD